ncbi:MAG: hypothetical protein E7269_05785 [Lachnospiraceae bacterium]|nr:hypothetical protein [Lachnospiraceae bacterium]
MTTYYKTSDGRYFGEDTSFYEFDLECITCRMQNYLFLLLLFLRNFYPANYTHMISEKSFANFKKREIQFCKGD